MKQHTHVHHTIYYTKIVVVREKKTIKQSYTLAMNERSASNTIFFKFIQIVKYFKRNFSLLCYIHLDLFLSLHFFCVLFSCSGLSVFVIFRTVTRNIVKMWDPNRNCIVDASHLHLHIVVYLTNIHRMYMQYGALWKLHNEVNNCVAAGTQYTETTDSIIHMVKCCLATFNCDANNRADALWK